MSDEQERRNAIIDISRADRANELLTNPLYLEAITAMNAAMYMEFQDTKLIDTTERHELWQRMQLMKQFQDKFEHIVKQGNKAQKTLTLLEKSLEVIGFR
jgi:hypothetical protein